MPVIPIDFDNVEAFDNLPLGKYMGEIDKLELRPAQEEGKFDQIQALYMVIDGELTGQKSSEFLSMSPKAAFRLKKWFDKFGLAGSGALTALDFDDDTNLLVDPDLVGKGVIFEVYQDPKLYQGEKQIRTRLVEVLEDEPAPAPKPRRAAKAEPVVEAEDDTEDEDPPEAAPVRRTARAAATATAGPARRVLK